MEEIRAHFDDPWLEPFRDAIEGRAAHAKRLAKRLAGRQKLCDWAAAHEYYGLHKTPDGWVFREWAPNATAIWLTGDFSGWELSDRFALKRSSCTGNWELALPADAIKHGHLSQTIYDVYVNNIIKEIGTNGTMEEK